MRSFEIFVAEGPAPHELPLGEAASGPLSAGAPSSHLRRVARPRARDVLDVFVGGANVTARVTDAHAPAILRDLAVAVAELAQEGNGKRIVRFYDEPWELCVERGGELAALSVYRAGAEAEVAVYDARVPFHEVVDAIREALGAFILRAPPALAPELAAAAEALAVPPSPAVEEADDAFATSHVVVELDRDVPIAFGAELVLRACPSSHGAAAEDAEAQVERPDVHALLFRGRVRAEVRGRSIDLGEGHPFLFAERFLAMARKALEAWEAGRAFYARGTSGGYTIGLRVSASGDASLTLGRAHGEAIATFPCLGVADLGEAVLGFGRAISRALLRRDRSQCVNLRLTSFRRRLRETSDALREACRADARINPSPEPYRAFAASQRANPRERETQLGGRLRYMQRWRALVPGIDLRATFLCGDRLVVGASAETFCLERATGQVLWRVPTTRATSVVTPGGIARLSPEGDLAVHDFGNGEITLQTRVAPRLGGPPAGAVVNLPGLPRLLIVTEGERHLCAVDLVSGEPRWRFAWSSPSAGRAGALRMKRSGRLLYLASGDSGLTALDVQTGRVVWRVRNRLRFRSAPVVDHDVLVALAGGANSPAEIVAVDPFSGHVRWKTSAAADGAPCTVEGTPLVTGRVVAVTLRDRHGLRLAAFARDTGEMLWNSEAQVAPIGTSWLVVDDLLLGNSPTGELLAIEADTGTLRYRHLLGSVLEADVPRRLEPVLRSGALFVPHVDVHVFRPSDGATLGTIGPCEAIPDLLRVDERGDVYVAEESGHLVSFGCGPRLTLVR